MFNGLPLRQFALAIACLVSLSATGGVFKWIDQDGNVHFTDQPPMPGEAAEISEQAPPKYRVPKGKTTVSTPSSTLDRTSTTLRNPKQLGRLPDNTKSKYLETKVAGFVVNVKKRSARYDLVLAARRGLPYGAVLDIEFENPANETNRLTATARRSGAKDRISVRSPDFWPIRCGSFLVEIYIYRNISQSDLLGIHQQRVQSRIDAEQARSTSDLIEAVLRGNCR